MNIQEFYFNLLRVHTIVVWDDSLQGAVIDPGMASDREKEEIESFIDRNRIEVRAILLTHGHFDHMCGLKWAQDRYGVPAYIHPADRERMMYYATGAARFRLPVPDTDFTATDIEDGDIITVGSLNFEVIHTPGHSPGGVCFLERSQKALFSGDTLFAGTIGRSDFEFGEYDDLIRSIMEKLIWLDSDIKVFPGHGQNTTIGRERFQNPMLEPFNEKDEITYGENGTD